MHDLSARISLKNDSSEQLWHFCGITGRKPGSVKVVKVRNGRTLTRLYSQTPGGAGGTLPWGFRVFIFVSVFFPRLRAHARVVGFVETDGFLGRA